MNSSCTSQCRHPPERFSDPISVHIVRGPWSNSPCQHPCRIPFCKHERRRPSAPASHYAASGLTPRGCHRLGRFRGPVRSIWRVSFPDPVIESHPAFGICPLRTLASLGALLHHVAGTILKIKSPILLPPEVGPLGGYQMHVLRPEEIARPPAQGTQRKTVAIPGRRWMAKEVFHSSHRLRCRAMASTRNGCRTHVTKGRQSGRAS